MPLNIKEKETPLIVDVINHEPILHSPQKERPLFRSIILVGFVSIVLASLIFLVYIFSDKKNIQTEPHNAIVTDHEQQRERKVDQPEALLIPVTEPSKAELSDRNLTIYIASYVNQSIANDEVTRWKEAGYSALVVGVDKHYRVSLGQFNTVYAAKQSAEELQEAFENGYWIGSLN